MVGWDSGQAGVLCSSPGERDGDLTLGVRYSNPWAGLPFLTHLTQLPGALADLELHM